MKLPFKPLALLSAALFLVNAALAQVSWAWRQTNNISTPAVTGGVDTDLSGNAYMSYMSIPTGSSPTLYVQKVGPSGVVDASTAITLPTGAELGGNLSGNFPATSIVKVSPGPAGSQMVFVTANYLDHYYSEMEVAIYAFDENLNQLWGAPKRYIGPGGGFFDTQLMGFDCDSSGNSYVVYQQFEEYTYLDTLSSDGVSGPHFGYLGNSYGTTVTNAYHVAPEWWLISGPTEATETLPSGGSWGDYVDPQPSVTGEYVEAFGNYASTPGISQQFIAMPLPGGYIGVIENTTNGSVDTYTLTEYASNGVPFRASQTEVGTATSISSYGVGYPVYVVGVNGALSGVSSGSNFVQAFTPGLTSMWVEHLASNNIWATSDGFFSEYTGAHNGATNSNPVFFDHSNTSGTFDWGTLYNEPANSPDNESFGGFVEFANRSFYVLGEYDNGSSYNVTLNRYALGVALSSLQAAADADPAFEDITVNLNAAAPTGGETVYLYLPGGHTFVTSGTSSESVVVPAGQTSVVAQVNALSAGQTLVVDGNCNDVLRYVSVTF